MLKKLLTILNGKKSAIISFGFAFALVAWLLYPQPDMLGGGGDVNDIWKTITTFYSGNIQSSYVLYKGFLSVYPYVWFYEFSKFLGINIWFFMKIFHCLLFSYVSAIGFPFIVSKLLKIEIKFWSRILLIFLMFIFWKTNMAFQWIMIDLPACTFFVLSVSAALKIAEKKIKTKKWFFIYTGIVMGLASTYTGQYMPAIILLIIYILTNIISFQRLKNSAVRLATILSIVLLFAGIMLPKTYNSHFEKTVVDPMRENGAWIPSGRDWLNVEIGRSKRFYNLCSDPVIINNRVLAIIEKEKGEIYNKFSSIVHYPRNEVVYFILKHPVDFITSWCNGFLLTVSIHGKYQSVLYLFSSYTTLFLALYAIFKRCKKLKEFFSRKFLIVLGFISTSLITCLMHFEPRYVMAFQGLFLSVGLLDDTLWDGFKNFWIGIKNIFKKKSYVERLTYLKETNFPYAFVIYVLFVIMCFTNYAALLENVGPDPSILFNWLY